MSAIVCPVPSPLTVPDPVGNVIESSPYAAGQLRRRQAGRQTPFIELVKNRPECERRRRVDIESYPRMCIVVARKRSRMSGEASDQDSG